MVDLTLALDFAHQNNIYHHNLKEEHAFTCEGKDKKPIFKLGGWGSCVKLENIMAET